MNILLDAFCEWMCPLLLGNSLGVELQGCNKILLLFLVFSFNIFSFTKFINNLFWIILLQQPLAGVASEKVAQVLVCAEGSEDTFVTHDVGEGGEKSLPSTERFSTRGRQMDIH